MKLNRSIAPDLLVSALLTLLVWFEFWGGRLPASLDGTILIIGVIGGAIVTIVGLVIKQTRVIRAGGERYAVFIIMAGIILIGLVLLPRGLPTAAGIGLLVVIWSWPMGRSWSDASKRQNANNPVVTRKTRPGVVLTIPPFSTTLGRSIQISRVARDRLLLGDTLMESTAPLFR